MNTRRHMKTGLKRLKASLRTGANQTWMARMVGSPMKMGVHWNKVDEREATKESKEYKENHHDQLKFPAQPLSRVVNVVLFSHCSHPI